MLGEVRVRRHRPEGDGGAALIRAVRVGRVKEARVANYQVARTDRHIHFVGIRLQHRTIPTDGGDLLAVGGWQAVEPLPPARRARDHAQAAVLPVGVDQIVHQEHLHRLVGIAARVVPEHAVLVPEQWRSHLWRFADDEPGG